MRTVGVLVLAVAMLVLAGCAALLSSGPPQSSWTTGFWFWQGSATGNELIGAPVDVLFVHVGNIGTPDNTYTDWPNELPPAREYWAVLRYGRQAVPDPAFVPVLAAKIVEIQAEASARRQHLAGIQLDVDAPTSALAQYANFVHELRKRLPRGCEISITALLDWFRPGTAVGDLVREADEFVPQFYDVTDPDRYDGGPAIASKIEAARWGPVFNAFRKRFRIGISTFGRAVDVRAQGTAKRHRYGFIDLRPLDIAAIPAFQLAAARNEANELVLTYRATRRTQISYNHFEPGEGIRFILPTPEAVRSAVQNARQMKGWIAGVVFFRWPASGESLTLQPDEALSAAEDSGGRRRLLSRIGLVDGRCTSVQCLDVYFESSAPLAAEALRYRIRSSIALHYFLPARNAPIRMAGDSDLELSLPPYCGRGRLYLGRAVAASRPEFTVEEAR